jgi:hypothetical protein
MTSTTTAQRIGAASGLAFVGLAFVGNGLATSGSTVDGSSSGTAILADLRDHDTIAAHAGIAMECLGFLALLAFVAYLGGLLRRAEGGDGWLASAAAGAGLLTLAVKVSSAAPMVVALARLDVLDPLTARTLVDLNGAAFVISWATMAAFVGFASLSALVSGALSRRLAGIGVALAAAGILLVPAGEAGPGVLPFLLSMLWIAVVSVVLVRRTTTEGAPQGALASVS